MQEEFTENNVRYKWDLAGPNGASFIVFQDDKSDKDVKQAISEIRQTRDVSHLRKANREDLVDDYWSKVFKYAEDTYGLNWQQINKDMPELYNAVRTGKSVEEYVDSKWENWRDNPNQNKY